MFSGYCVCCVKFYFGVNDTYPAVRYTMNTIWCWIFFTFRNNVLANNDAWEIAMCILVMCDYVFHNIFRMYRIILDVLYKKYV